MEESNMSSSQMGNEDQVQNNQQNFTYYYSSFDLFDEVTEFTFLKYTKFVKKLQSYLGGDWQVYASTTVFSMLEDVQKFLHYEEVFDIALQSWLDVRNNFNKQRKSSFDDENSKHEEEIQYFEENEIYERFLTKFAQNLQGYQVNKVTFKAVAHGFFMSAVEIWNETIKTIKNQRILSENSLYELGLQEEQKLREKSKSQIKSKQEKRQRKSQEQQQQSEEEGSYIGQLYKNIYKMGRKNQIIKPLIVASETIIGYLGHKQVKKEADRQLQMANEKKNVQQEEEDEDSAQNYQKPLNQAQQKNFDSFKNNLLSEEEVVMHKIRKISIQEQTLNRKRKQHEMQLEQEFSDNEDDEQQQSQIQVENFPRKAEKLNEQVFNYATHYFENLKKNTQEKWQVARGFVTNIIELNNNILSKTQKISSEYTSSIKIRFLQPAQQFYNHLMEIWILFRQNSQGSHDFKRYLEKVKQSMGNKWSETYVLPTQFFFKTLVYTWEQLVKEEHEDTDEDTLIKLFVERVRQNMLKNWENDIVNKIKHFKNKNNEKQQQQQQQQQSQLSKSQQLDQQEEEEEKTFSQQKIQEQSQQQYAFPQVNQEINDEDQNSTKIETEGNEDMNNYKMEEIKTDSKEVQQQQQNKPQQKIVQNIIIQQNTNVQQQQEQQ